MKYSPEKILWYVICIENYSFNNYDIGYIYEKHVQTKRISANRWNRKGVYDTLEYMQKLFEIFFKSYNTTEDYWPIAAISDIATHYSLSCKAYNKCSY